MNLTEWAGAQGVHVTTAYRWYREGVLPVPARKAGRLILVSAGKAAMSALGGAGLYARVSSLTRGPTWTGRSPAVSAWAVQARMPVVRVEAEVGSGMNGARARARRLLADPAAAVIVVEHGPAGADERGTGRGRPGRPWPPPGGAG